MSNRLVEERENVKDAEGNEYVPLICVSCGAQAGYLQAGPQECGGYLDPKKPAHCQECQFCAPDKVKDKDGELELDCIEAREWLKAREN